MLFVAHVLWATIFFKNIFHQTYLEIANFVSNKPLRPIKAVILIEVKFQS